MDSEFELTEENVNEIFYKCIYENNSNGFKFEMPIIGGKERVTLDGFSVLDNSKKISDMFFQLFDTGEKKSYSMFFLNDELRVWTSSLEMVEKLVILAVANGDVEHEFNPQFWPNDSSFEPNYILKRKNPHYAELTSESLRSVYNECFALRDIGDAPLMRVEGANMDFIFFYDKIRKNSRKIANFITQIGTVDDIIPFSDLSTTIYGREWIEDPLDIEILIGLGVANENIELEFPREFTKNYPKRRPNVILKKSKLKEIGPTIS